MKLGQVTYEITTPRSHGKFTFDLFTALAKSRNASAHEILARVASGPSDEEDRHMPLSPVVYGDVSRSFLFPSSQNPTAYYRYELRPRRLESVVALEELYKGATGTGATTPGLHAAFGLAFLERGKYSSAAEALTTAVGLSHGGDRPEPSVALGERTSGRGCTVKPSRPWKGRSATRPRGTGNRQAGRRPGPKALRREGLPRSS